MRIPERNYMIFTELNLTIAFYNLLVYICLYKYSF